MIDRWWALFMFVTFVVVLYAVGEISDRKRR